MLGLEYLTSALTPERGGLRREEGRELDNVICNVSSSNCEITPVVQLPALFQLVTGQLFQYKYDISVMKYLLIRHILLSEW